MSWFRVDDTLFVHRKARSAGVEAMGLWVLLGSYMSSQAARADGTIDLDEVETVALGVRFTGWETAFQRLVSSGLLEAVETPSETRRETRRETPNETLSETPHETRYVFHDHEHYATREGAAEMRESRKNKSTERVQKHRAKRLETLNETHVTVSETRHETPSETPSETRLETDVTSRGSETRACALPVSTRLDPARSQSASERADRDPIGLSELRSAYGAAREFATGQMSPPHFGAEDLDALATLIKFRDVESPGETFAKWLELRFGEWIASIDHEHPARLTVGYAPRFFTRFLDRSKPELVAVKPKRDASYDPTKDPHSIRYIHPPCTAPLPAVLRAQAAAKREADRAAAALATAPAGEVGT